MGERYPSAPRCKQIRPRFKEPDFQGEIRAERGAEAVAERGGLLDEEEAWDVVAEIPEDSAGMVVLLEHRWAIPLRDAIARAGGFRLASEFISPLDLVAIGLVSAEEAAELEAADSGAV
jgi:hypothetical protein